MNKEFFSRFCHDHDFEFVKSLDENKRKDTAVLLVKSKTSNKNSVLKFYGSLAPSYSKEAIQKEINFYQQHNSEFLLTPVCLGENFICLEYYSGNPLRDEIDSKLFQESQNFDDIVLLEKARNMLDWFHYLEKGLFAANKTEAKFIVESIFDRIGNLMSSGPKKTTRPNFEYFILRQIYKILSPRFKNNLTKLINSWTQKNYNLLSKFGHNDLHCRNILTDKKIKTLKIIDFENLSSPGSWLSDLLYFYVTLYACFSSNRNMKEKIKKQTIHHIKEREPRFTMNEINNLINMFFLAAEVNSRWRLHDKGIKFNKIILFALSLFKF